MKKQSLIFWIIVLIVIVIIAFLTLKNNNSVTAEQAECISSKSLIYVSRTCSHCAEQKIILGKYYDLFNIIDCIDEEEKCIQAEITGFPTWFINGKEYKGVQSWKKLKSITGC